jgi:uncharacterized protein YbcI
MTGFTTLRQAIIDKINEKIADGTIEYIGEAYFSYADVTKTPAVIVMPESLESSYQNTAGGRHRTFVFRVYVIKEVEKGNQTDIEKLLGNAIDELIELFDKKDALSADGLLHIRPTPSIWDWVDVTGGEARMATITLTADVIIETT